MVGRPRLAPSPPVSDVPIDLPRTPEKGVLAPITTRSSAYFIIFITVDEHALEAVFEQPLDNDGILGDT